MASELPEMMAVSVKLRVFSVFNERELIHFLINKIAFHYLCNLWGLGEGQWGSGICCFLRQWWLFGRRSFIRRHDGTCPSGIHVWLGLRGCWDKERLFRRLTNRRRRRLSFRNFFSRLVVLDQLQVLWGEILLDIWRKVKRMDVNNLVSSFLLNFCMSGATNFIYCLNSHKNV